MPDVTEQLLDQVRAAFDASASPATKQAGAQACRMLLAALDPTAVTAAAAAPSSAPSSAPTAGPSAAADPLGAVLEGLIARFGHLLPPDDPTRPPPMSIPIIAIPPNLFPKG